MTTMESAGAVETAKARGELYRFLAGLFLDPPGGASVEQLGRDPVLDGLQGLYGDEAVEALRRLEPDPEAATREFDRLFRVPTGGFVPPCESFHRDTGDSPAQEPARLYGPVCRLVAESIREAGVALPKDRTEPPDHLGMELLFLAYVCDEEARMHKEGNEDGLRRWIGREIHFLKFHLTGWIGPFAAAVRASVPDGFYAAVTRLVESVAQRNLVLLEET